MEQCNYIHRPITTIESLASALGKEKELLLEVSSLDDARKYRRPKSNVYKKDGSRRNIMTPVREVRSIQYRINQNIFKKSISWPNYLFGSIPKADSLDSPQDYIEAAHMHCGAKTICSLDVSDFFDNVHSDDVFDIFSRLFRYSEEVSDILTKLVTYKEHLVQGALTSSYLAMLVLWEREPLVVEKLKRKKIVYTRLVDDITLSAKKHDYDFSLGIKEIENMLHDKGLYFNATKIDRQCISNQLLLVHGLNVTKDHPALPKNEAKKIRAAVRNIESIALKGIDRKELWYRKEYNRCLGRVFKLKRFGKLKSFKNLKNRLEKIKPIPSQNDVRYSKIRVSALENDFVNIAKRDSYNYLRRYSIANHRVSFLKDYFQEDYLELRRRLRLILPTYQK